MKSKENSQGLSRLMWFLLVVGVGHFFYGWIILNKGWKTVTAISLIFFDIAAFLFLFLFFYLLNSGFF